MASSPKLSLTGIPLPHPRPGLAHDKLRVGALARRVFLDSAGSHFGGVEIALFVRGESVHAPHAALAGAKRSPGIEEVSAGVVGEELVRSLVGGPENMVGAHVDAVNVHRRARTEIPLVQKFSVFVQLITPAVVWVVSFTAPRVRADGGSRR